jgi:dTMP kinase
VENNLNFLNQSLIHDRAPRPKTGERAPGKNAVGRLIVFEGLDGAGKTTQIELLARNLRKKGLLVVITSWNSSRMISKAIKRAKKAKLLTPYLYSTLHAADFMYRLESIIIPALDDGAIVIADRYAYTALARDLSRNVDRRWVESLYALAPKPDLAFYCSVSVEEALGRIVDPAARDGHPPGYYESGMDVIRQENPRHSFREFQSLVSAEYDRIHSDFGLIKIDASAPIADVHGYVSSIVEQHLSEWRNGNGHPAGSTRGTGFNRSAERSEGKSEADPFTALVKHSFPGRLVVVEGSEKVATARQANVIYNELLTEGYDVRLASLGNSWIGSKLTRKALRKTSLSLTAKVFLAASEIALFYEQLIIPALKSGALVIMDGYLSSVYAEAVANGLRPEWFNTMFQIFHVKPDLTFFLDAGPGNGTAKRTPPQPADRGILEIYRTLAGREGWQRISVPKTGKEPDQQTLTALRRVILPALQRGEPDGSLREVLSMFSHFDPDFDHPRKVGELAVSLFDQTKSLHSFGQRERRLLLYAAILHDIGHSLSDIRHEEFTFEAIMQHRFDTIPERDKEIVAIVAFLHRQPYVKLKFQHLKSLNETDQQQAMRLAALLRIADALDESGKRIVRDIRCYEEQGAFYVDLHAVPKAIAERSAVLRKADLFEHVFQRTVVVVRNGLEKRARDQHRVETGGLEKPGR